MASAMRLLIYHTSMNVHWEQQHLCNNSFLITIQIKENKNLHMKRV